MTRPTEEERLARRIWTGIAEPGDADAGAIVREFGAARALASVEGDATPVAQQRWREAFARWRPRRERVDQLEQSRRAERSQAVFIVPGDDAWPLSLTDLGDHAPLGLWVRGDPGLLAARPSIAMVGARAASGYGELVTSELASGLATEQITIVSGGAYGIDGIAHRAALGVGGGTVAVLACGVDRVYPAGHAPLLARIASQGAIVSELPLGTPPTRWRFLLRNRVIAALSDATVVVEAGRRSGSLNTAGHAASLGRPLGAVPGPITSAVSAGCHRVLREYDATCVTSVAEVRELLGLPVDAAITSTGTGALSTENRLLEQLHNRRAQTIDDLAAGAGLAVHDVEATLGYLQLAGRVESADDGWRLADSS